MVRTGQNHRPWFPSFFCVASRRWVGAGSGGVAHLGLGYRHLGVGHRLSGAIGQPAQWWYLISALGTGAASGQLCHWPAGTTMVSASSIGSAVPLASWHKSGIGILALGAAGRHRIFADG